MEMLLFETSSALHLHKYLLILAICTITVWCVQFWWTRKKLRYHVRNTPGPFALPIFGNLHLFWSKDPMTVVFTMFPELEKKYSSRYRLWFGFSLVYIVSSVEYSEEILNSPKSLNKHSYLYRYLKHYIGDGLITSSDSKWRKHRKLISPSFNQTMMGSFVPIFDKQSDILIDVLIEKAGIKKIQLYHMLCECTLDIVSQSTLGVNINVQKSEENFGEIIEELLVLTAYRMFCPWLANDIIWNLTSSGKKHNYYLNKLYDKVNFIIKTKLDAWNEQKKQNELNFDAAVDEKSKNKRSAILDFVRDDSVLTEEELKSELHSFIIAGTETTASTLCFIFVVLGLFPEIQHMVYEEVMDVFGSNGPITKEGLLKMKYLERVIKETMRLFPTVPVIARAVTEDLVIGDQVHPEGSGIAMNIFMLHRNPKYWPDPLKFDPDRFLPERVAKRNPYTYLAFAMGPRICIGWRYAMLLMEIILAKVVRNFKVHTEYKSIEEIELAMHFVLRLKNGPKVWMEKR